MTYLKSFVVGLIAAASAAVLSLSGIALYFIITALSSRASNDVDAVGIDFVSLLHPPIWMLVFAGVAFVGGFLWEYRRSSN